jgi:8-oxo-dGTP pyrophosphatase MutT (NUDIX family)
MVYFRLGERTRVLLVDGDEVLLVKTWVGNGKWNLPGGGLHRHEDPAVGAIREVHEETGLALRAAQVTPLGVGVYNAVGIRFRYHVLIATVSKTVRLRRQRREIAQLAWLPVRDIHPDTCSQEVLGGVVVARQAGLLQ